MNPCRALPEVPQTFARSSCGRRFKLGAPGLVLEPLIQGKLKEMLNIKTKFDTFQILGEEEFLKRTNTRSWEGREHAKILTKSIPSD